MYKELGKHSGSNSSHPLSHYEYHAIATYRGIDEVLFAVHHKEKNIYNYVVLKLTWKGRLEEQTIFPRAEFFEAFAHFLYYKMYPDKIDWEY